MSDRRATSSIVRAVRRRVERKPGSKLLLETVRRVPIGRTGVTATVFIYEQGDSHVFIAEVTEPDLPHVYNSTTVKLTTGDISRALAYTLKLLGHTVTHDPRFNRGKIIQLNGASR